MRIGLALPQFDFSVPGERPLRWETVEGWARRAEDLGFASLWVADHLFWDLGLYGAAAQRVEVFAPLPALGALARATTTVRLGTLVLNGVLRPPSILAKSLATVDVLSDGRLIAGIGAGWYEPEFAAAGVPFERPGVRLAQLVEAMQVLRGMWTGGPFTFHGRYWSTSDARCRPVPLQRPHPPLWVGGRGDALLRLVARHADGWNTVWAWTADAYRERLAVLDRACEQTGRDPATVTRSLGLYTLIGEDEADLRRRFGVLQEVSPPGLVERLTLSSWRRGRLVGTVDQVREQVEQWAELGVAELIVSTGAAPFAVVDPDDLEMVAAACSLGPPCQPQDRSN